MCLTVAGTGGCEEPLNQILAKYTSVFILTQSILCKVTLWMSVFSTLVDLLVGQISSDDSFESSCKPIFFVCLQHFFHKSCSQHPNSLGGDIEKLGGLL